MGRCIDVCREKAREKYCPHFRTTAPSYHCCLRPGHKGWHVACGPTAWDDDGNDRTPELYSKEDGENEEAIRKCDRGHDRCLTWQEMYGTPATSDVVDAELEFKVKPSKGGDMYLSECRQKVNDLQLQLEKLRRLLKDAVEDDDTDDDFWSTQDDYIQVATNNISEVIYAINE